MSTADREEWIRRYAARVRQQAGWSLPEAEEAARVGAEVYAASERAAGNAVVWCLGLTLGPEHYADDEMSYWEE